MKRTEVKTKFNDKDVIVSVTEVTPRVRRDAEKYANIALKRALEDGYILNIEIDAQIKKSGIDVNDHQKIEDFLKEIKLMEMKLLSGRDGDIKLTKLEGRKLALEIRNKRREILLDRLSTHALYARTAERYAENERNQYHIYASILDPNTNRPFFKTFDEFKDSLDSDLILDASNAFYKILESENDSEKTNPEVKWLIKFGFMNDKLELIDSNGRLCDTEFRLIDKDGRFIDDDGKYIDKYGNRIDEDGNLIIEADPDSYKV